MKFRNKSKTNNIHKNAGFTIAETIVAITILLTATASAVAVVTQVTRGVSAARNRTIAANLAQEGAEIVRATRDDSWIINESYDDPFQDGVDGCVTFIGDEITFTYNDTDLCGDFSLYWNEDVGRFTHNQTVGSKTPFKRVVRVSLMENPVEDTEYRDPPPDVLKVESIVSWGSNDMIVENHLYDWR